MRLPRAMAPALLAALVACGESVTQVVPDGEGDYEIPDLNAELDGTFEGAFRSEDQGITLNGVLTLELMESDAGELVGSFALTGVLLDDALEVPIGGTGTLVGSVSADQLASVSFTATPDFCSEHAVGFSGEFDRRDAGLVIGGSVLVFGAGCVVALTFVSTIAMSP